MHNWHYTISIISRFMNIFNTKQRPRYYLVLIATSGNCVVILLDREFRQHT